MVIRHKGKNQKARSFKNTPEGHAQIIKALTSKKGKVRVCLEATGIYHFDVAVALSRSNTVEVMVVNPKASRHFAEALMTRSKTDQVDANILAQFAETMPLPSSRPRRKINFTRWSQAHLFLKSFWRRHKPPLSF
jgi:transposase